LLGVGRIVREKRFDLFITALSRLRRQCKLEVCGRVIGPPQDQDLANELKSLGAQLGVFPDHLEFAGSNGDMALLYHRADLCVLTSDYEGTPNVLLEAMASGVPVVAMKVGGVPEIVQHGETGLLVEPGDLDGLVMALKQLAEDPARRAQMGRRACSFMREHHSLGRLPAILAALYEAALPAQRGSSPSPNGSPAGVSQPF
jgi:glycosyltransferase involved in cell wall biosynthesis